MKNSYDTYRACPQCGLMVPQGTKICNCGYHFLTKRQQVIGRISSLFCHFGPLLLCSLVFVALVCYAGYRLGYTSGQKSMDDELQHQYSIGLAKGTKSGEADAKRNYSFIFEDGYQSALQDAGIREDSLPWLYHGFPGRDSLRQSLAEQSGLSVYRKPFSEHILPEPHLD